MPNGRYTNVLRGGTANKNTPVTTQRYLPHTLITGRDKTRSNNGRTDHSPGVFVTIHACLSQLFSK